MQTGVVKRFNKVKGYGFITPDNGGPEVFVHYSKIKADGYKELIEGQRVQYDVEKGDRGEFANNVEAI
jgi:CspA family cold shock protein